MSSQTNHNHHHPDNQHHWKHHPNLLVILLTYMTTATTTHHHQPHLPPCNKMYTNLFVEQHEGLLQGKVVPQTVNRLTKFMKILDSGEDNPICKKTTFTMSRESGTEKKMKTKGDNRKQDNCEDVKLSLEDIFRRRPGLLPASVDNCVSSRITENTTAVQSSCASSQIENPSKLIDRQYSLVPPIVKAAIRLPVIYKQLYRS